MSNLLRLIKGAMGMGSADGVESVEMSREEVAAQYGISPGALDFDAESFALSDRRRELVYRSRFYKCEQHDGKTFDFDGRLSNDGPAWGRQRLWGSTPAAFFVPFDSRRPSTPYRLPRKIVRDFTDLVFGHGQFPSVVVKGSPVREDWIQAVAEVMGLQSVMVRARNIGGSCGTVGISWKVSDGKFRAQTHSGSNLYVHGWLDRDSLEPAHVTEIYQFTRNERDPKSGKVVAVAYWFRRDWTPTADVAFHEVPVEDGIPMWTVDEANSWDHGDGRPHLIWVVNEQPEENSEIDGQPDYAETYESFDAVDILNSVVFNGAKKNLDPTLVVKTEKDASQIRKGSDNALVLEANGADATYLEMAGTSITAGLSLVSTVRAQVLETSRCVSPDPDKIAAAGTSSLALKMIYRPMLGAGDALRVQYGDAIKKLLGQIVAHVERMSPEETEEGTAYPMDPSGDVYEPFYALSPRVVEVKDPTTGEPMRDEDGNPIVEFIERKLGPRGTIGLEWPDYFKPGPDDYQKQGAAFSLAVGGNGAPPVMAQRTAVEAFAQLLNRDPAKEWQLVREEMERHAADAASGMAPPAGLVGGGPDAPDAMAEEKPVELTITPTDLATIVTVNQALASVGLPARTDPDGFLTIAEFKAKHSDAIAAGSAAAAGKPPPVAEMPAEAPALDPMASGLPAAPNAPQAGSVEQQSHIAPMPVEPLAKTSKQQAAELAAKMTEHGVEQCQHGKQNRCWICGIERARDFEPGEDGPEWKVAWQPIADSP